MATRYFVLLSVILAGVDQLTKFLARAGLGEGVRHDIIPDFFRITLNFNQGIAWGMLPEWSEYFTYFAIVMVLVILMILRRLDRDEVWLKIALAFQMAGAIGNMTDRLIRHRVTDFIDVRLFLPGTGWQYDWPIFNLADSFVVVGTVVLVLVLVFAADRPATQITTASRVKAGLGPMEGEPGWTDRVTPPGSVPVEEGLIEIGLGQQSEMLMPLEEAEAGKNEASEQPSGSPDSDAAQGEESLSPQDRDKLDDFRRPPAP